jgi:hypothetical protein
MVDKGFSKAPNVVPRVRPRVKAVEEPKKKLKVDEQTIPAVEEDAVEDVQQEPEKVDAIQPAGNVISIPQMITPEAIVSPTVADCPIIMKDLIKSKFRDGQLSKLEITRRQLIAEKRKGRLKEEIKPPEPEAVAEVEEEIHAPRGPQIRLVNGEMVIDETSLMVAPEKEKLELQRIEEGATRYVSSASFRVRQKTGRVKWTQELTDQFYDGLSYFGTDFGLVALLFPEFSRNMIKLKYNHEERANSSRVSQALMNRKVPGEDLKMQMKHNLTTNMEKESTNAAHSKVSRKGSKKARQEKDSAEVNTIENAEGDDQEQSAAENIQPSPTVVEKVFQETAQKSFEDAIGNVQALSSSFLKPAQGPKIAPKVRKRPPRKEKSGGAEE